MEALCQAGCDDATFSTKGDLPFAAFTRGVPSLLDAVVSAIEALESVGLEVLRVDPDELVGRSTDQGPARAGRVPRTGVTCYPEPALVVVGGGSLVARYEGPPPDTNLSGSRALREQRPILVGVMYRWSKMGGTVTAAARLAWRSQIGYGGPDDVATPPRLDAVRFWSGREMRPPEVDVLDVVTRRARYTLPRRRVESNRQAVRGRSSARREIPSPTEPQGRPGRSDPTEP